VKNIDISSPDLVTRMSLRMPKLFAAEAAEPSATMSWCVGSVTALRQSEVVESAHLMWETVTSLSAMADTLSVTSRPYLRE
jgi:hypothetical protein